MAQNIDIIAIPSLSEDGWVFSGAKQADYIMAHFIASAYSQSYIHNGAISSFGWLVATYGNDPVNLISETRRVLENLFNQYFNNVKVECSDITDPAKPSRFILSIAIQYQTADGSLNDLVQLASIVDSKFQIINNVILNGSN